MAETFVVACRRMAEVPDEATAWLLAVARRVLANQRRATGRRNALDQRLEQAPPVGSGIADDPAQEVAERMALGDALAALGERDREALLLVAWDGLDNRSAAVVMNCSPASFTVRLHRARRRLLKHLQRMEPTTFNARIARVGWPEETK